MNHIKCSPHRSKVQRWVFMLLAVVMVMGALTGFTYPTDVSASTDGIYKPYPDGGTCPYAGCWPDPYPNPCLKDPCAPDPFPWPHPKPPTWLIPSYGANTAVQAVKDTTIPGTILFGSGREWGDDEHVACYLDCSFDYPEGSLDQNICLQRCDRRVNYPLPWHVMTQ